VALADGKIVKRPRVSNYNVRGGQR